MSETLKRIGVLALSAGLLNCNTASETPDQNAPGQHESAAVTAASSGVDVDQPRDPQDAAIPWRWIGTRTDLTADCPEPVATVPGVVPWKVRPLFKQDDGSSIPPGLLSLCVYERDRPADLAALRNLVTTGDLADVETDYMAGAPAASVLRDAVWQELRGHFLTQAGRVDLPSVATPTRLALLDTGATHTTGAEKYLGNSPHGYTLSNMAKDLLCDSGRAMCLAQVTARLALAYETFDQESATGSGRNEAEGGLIGTIGDLAEAIRQEVHEWESSGSGERLVLNLSMAWLGDFGGLQAAATDMPLAVQAVYRALRDATCRGALVIAAAGNAGGGPMAERGPLLPAAWEARPAPDLARCGNLIDSSELDPSNFPSGVRPYRPLIYAAGGIRSGGEALANARLGGTPRLVAFADHAVAVDPGRHVPTAILTGSSVAALVTSATAAAVWSYRPSLSSYQVMEIVYQSGDDLGRGANFCLGGSRRTPCPDSTLNVRRVSLCAAFTEACAGGDEACPPDLPTCGAWPGEALSLAATDRGSFVPVPSMIVNLDTDVTQPYATTASVCRGENLLHKPSVTPLDPCPHRQYYGHTVESWTEPQPTSDPCPACELDYQSPGKLYVEIDEYFSGTLTDATLIIGSATYNLGLGSLSAGDIALVEDIPMLADSSTPVSISFTVNHYSSATSSVLVLGAE